MTYTEEDIIKYQDLCREYFNEEVSHNAAIEEMNSLMFLMNLIYHPQLKEHLEKNSKSTLDSNSAKSDDQ